MNNKTFNPYIELLPFPINSGIDDIEDDAAIPLYHVIVSQGQLKMLFLVIQHDQNAKRQFETLRCEYVGLHGIDERDEYLQEIDNIAISANVSIVNKIFEYSLSPFKLKLIEANFHNFEFFESEIEGKGFIFEDKQIYEELKDRINEKCILMLSNPKVNQY